MPLTKFTENVSIHQTKANRVKGQAPVTKAYFDKPVEDIQDFINDTLTVEIDAINTTQTDALNTHKSSSDHDGRYYTETEVNNALALKADDSSVMHNTGNETIGGFKTFTNSPIVTIRPVLDGHLATKGYVDDTIGGVVLGQIPDGTLTDAKLSNTAGQIKDTLTSHLADNTKHLSVMTTEGDLVYRGAANPARLAKGTALQQLRMNASATAPEWSDVPSCRVYHNANQSIANSTNVALAFNTERWDTDTIHDNVTNNTRLTCKTAGKYYIMGNICWDIGASYKELSIKLNGAKIYGHTRVQTTSSNDRMQTATIIDMAVNDYVELIATQYSGGAINVLASDNVNTLQNCEFMMVKVG